VAATALCAGPALAAGSAGGSSSKNQGGSSSGGASVAANPDYSSGNPFGRQTLKQGMSGGKITLLQFYLNVVGYPTPVDGQFGSETRHSVVAFQSSNGLTQTGRVGQKTGRAVGGAIQQVEAIKPNGKTKIHYRGKASAPSNAPAVVKAVVAAANRIINTSYCYAGGHGSWKSSCYDCSGSVSYALHGADLLSSPEDSTSLESYGAPGRGRWITIYANANHTFLVVAGRAFDTADFGGPNRPSGTGPRWRSNPTGNLADGSSYVVRHPPGL
jgi:hypothetical protein